jgi:hypothetical protein
MSNNSPLAVTDEQMTMIYRASDALLPQDQPAFLTTLATRLRAEPIVGDGSIGRAIREVQRQYLQPPPKTEAHAPKYVIRDLGSAIGRDGRRRPKNEAAPAPQSLTGSTATAAAAKASMANEPTKPSP